MPAGAADLVAATGGDDAFDDRFPTQPLAVGRSQAGLVLGGHHWSAPDATSRRMPPAHRGPPPSWHHTTDSSLHVSGDAVDLGPAAATAWLSQHGADYGLCQTYRNEPWHYERGPTPSIAVALAYAAPTHDPRTQK